MENSGDESDFSEVPDAVRPPPSINDPSAVLRSEELFRGQREVLIVHAQEVYRLRLTRNGKLILTK